MGFKYTNKEPLHNQNAIEPLKLASPNKLYQKIMHQSLG